MKQPECLHIPTLYEGEAAPISWGTVGADVEYVIERVFNETFSKAISGYSWQNIDSLNYTWNEHDQENLNWKQIETRPGKGHTWERTDYAGLSWSEIENYSLTWKQIENQETDFEIYRGLGIERKGFKTGATWLELDGQSRTWDYFDSVELPWSERELIMLPGLSWEAREARWLTFADWENKDLTFDELDTLMGIKEHRGMEDFIPIGANNAMYRIKTCDPTGEESDYLTTDQVPIIPIFYRSSEVGYPVKAGKAYFILLTAADVYGLDRVKMNLIYDTHILALNSMSAHSAANVLQAGNYENEYLELYSHHGGNMWFRSTRPVKTEECFSGPIALVKFTAKRTGIATIALH